MIQKTTLQLALEFLTEKPGYLKKSALSLAIGLNKNDPNSVIEVAEQALKLAKSLHKSQSSISSKRFIPDAFLGGNKNNILVIGDLHEPFCLDEYLIFNRNLQEQFNCGTVVFIGDIIDNHYTSYHEVESSALGADDEFLYAKSRISDWYKVFPEAYVTMGNHDRLIMRKCKSGGISKYWMKTFSQALDTPNWKFVESIVLNNILFIHGENGTAERRMTNETTSVVQGHLHSEGYIKYGVGNTKFGMQVGCGTNMDTYAMVYAKDSKKPFLGSGVIVNNIPMLIPLT
jgi:metallophosphoesterase superfamily enzyme